MGEMPQFRPEFFDYFGGSFDADVIDLDDMDDLMYRAEGLALTLLSIGLTPDEIAVPLSQVLSNMTPEIVRLFSIASNGWWDADEQVEGEFRAILERIALAANGGATLAYSILPELDGVGRS